MKKRTENTDQVKTKKIKPGIGLKIAAWTMIILLLVASTILSIYWPKLTGNVIVISGGECTNVLTMAGSCTGEGIPTAGGVCTGCYIRTYCDESRGNYRTCSRTDYSCSEECIVR